jgi:hypothetical protein
VPKWEQQVRKDTTQKEGRMWEEIKEDRDTIDEERWLLDDLHKTEMSIRKKKEEIMMMLKDFQSRCMSTLSYFVSSLSNH